ncbi:RNA polymerase subunit sigma [Rhizobium sp. Root149]|uniref:RNA polymerase sigma-70 factor (ECF subfamily) n=1 Tax=Rhizobium rhizoryzae TaxID=451876 RepID=A0A7W6PS71_9HYPH|nr:MULTISPECIES: sigma-70 family RNA polymerase sigma factor [Rhizobium]KQZ50645.1 RNA polymerase subunit sigma [Rhizobium sp. Root149]MBB4143430.1 RNA polymerase sigma-70 factor (ECF subfamily) [Rhizobium rhizoryzae]
MGETDLPDLLARVALQDRAAFHALYLAASPKLFGICLRLLKVRSDAEDALQEIFVKIWYRADRFVGGQTSAMPWLCAIARNHSLDVLRSRKQETENLDDEADSLVDDAPDPEAQTVISGEGRRIDRCMQELDPDRAQAVRAAYVDGMSYQELAERYDVPLNTMRTWLRRSLLKLRECMDR